ncbi:MAG: DUF3800 domain-containing protein [Sphingomonadales bacterium]|nr:DUF3800 domain-containing protein [Sphingomonadales bacterium]
MSHSICYVDEAGCATPLNTAVDSIQPVFLITGLFINQAHVARMTHDFTALKKKYFPARFAGLRHQLDAMPIELKGIDIKKALRGDNGKSARKHHERFVDDVLEMLKRMDAKIASEIWIKGIGRHFKGHSIYALSTQRVTHLFEDHLFRHKHRGVIVSDFRSPGENRIVSHSIFTQMYRKKKKGNAYPSLLEAPLFGVSNNHAGLQITDILTSSLLCPMATFTYCTGHVTNVHVSAADQNILARYTRRIRALQYVTVRGGVTVRGIAVNDALTARGAVAMLG